MGFIQQQYFPNKIQPVKHSGAATTWRIIASDGSDYASLAALQSAGKKAWPGLDPGMMLGVFTLKSESNASADGSGFYFALNPQTTPTDANATFVAGGTPGYTNAGPLWQLWLRKTVSTDLIDISGAH